MTLLPFFCAVRAMLASSALRPAFCRSISQAGQGHAEHDKPGFHDARGGIGDVQIIEFGFEQLDLHQGRAQTRWCARP